MWKKSTENLSQVEMLLSKIGTHNGTIELQILIFFSKEK